MKKQRHTKKPATNRKRHGEHHRKTKKYHAAYWPYIPLLLVIFSVFLVSLVRSPLQFDVLSFATEMSNATLLEETNQERQRHDRDPLTHNDQLAAAARAKAEDMAQRNYWSHTTPEGEEPWIFIDEAGYQYQKAGENLAYGFLSSTQTVNGWMNSPSHRENILDPVFEEVGFGYVNAVNFQGSDKKTIVVALYAQPLEPLLEQRLAAEPEPEATEEVQEPEQALLLTTIESTEPPTTQVASDGDTRVVNRLESLAGDRFSWMSLGLGVLSGGAATGLFVSHGIRLKRVLRRSEQFILHHPLLDVSLISLLLLAAFLVDHVGYIL